MNNLKGTYLEATASLNGTYFENARILIIDENKDGSTGFITNRLFPRKLNELQEFSTLASIDIYEGGPVDTEHLFFIHRAPDRIEGGVPVTDKLFFGGNFSTAIQLLNDGQLSANDVTIFIGYCGWNAGELQAELDAGDWLVNTVTR